MKALREFTEFKHEEFFKDKTLAVKEVKPTKEYKNGKATGNVLGTTIVVTVISDKTRYANKESNEPLNLFQDFNLKVDKINFLVPYGAIVDYKGVKKVSIYGDYMNNISMEVEDIVQRKNNG